MATNARNDYTAGASQDTFSITFDFDATATAEILVHVDFVLQIEGVGDDYTIIGTDVVFNTPLIGGEYVKLKRQSGVDEKVDFNAQTIVDNADLNLMYTQILRLHQEERQEDSRELHDGPAGAIADENFQFWDTATLKWVAGNPVTHWDTIDAVTTADKILIADASDGDKLKESSIAQLMVGAGSGDVIGPAGAVDDRIAAFDSTTGKIIKDGLITASQLVTDSAKLGLIEDNAKDDQTGAEIKTAYEGEDDTNAYPDADVTKMGFISITQAVDLDTVETDTVANNAKVTYPPGDATKVAFISVTQAVNLDTIESDTATNNAKISATEDNVVAALDGATIPNVTPVAADGPLFQDDSDSDALVTNTWDSIFDEIAVIADDFLSSGQTITSAALLTLGHGLARSGSLVDPKDIFAYIKCTSTDAGHAVGDKVSVDLNCASDASTSRYNNFRFDDTNIYVRMSNQTQVFVIGNKATGVAVGATNSKWDLYVGAKA